MLRLCGGVQQNRPASPSSMLVGHDDTGKAFPGTPADGTTNLPGVAVENACAIDQII